MSGGADEWEVFCFASSSDHADAVFAGAQVSRLFSDILASLMAHVVRVAFSVYAAGAWVLCSLCKGGGLVFARGLSAASASPSVSASGLCLV